MAVMSGADGWAVICEWAESKRDLLLRALPLPKGLPSKDVFRPALMDFEAAGFQACFVNWQNALRRADSNG